jgi:hypothetical protein
MHDCSAVFPAPVLSASLPFDPIPANFEPEATRLAELGGRLDAVMVSDRQRLGRRIETLNRQLREKGNRRADRADGVHASLDKLARDVDAAERRLTRRAASVPPSPPTRW